MVRRPSLAFLAQRHASLAILLCAASRFHKAAAVPLLLYLVANHLGGRMTATAAVFFFIALPHPPGGPAAGAILWGAVGRAASLVYQWQEKRWLIPRARARGWRFMLDGEVSVLFWSVVLLASTAFSLWAALVLRAAELCDALPQQPSVQACGPRDPEEPLKAARGFEPPTELPGHFGAAISR